MFHEENIIYLKNVNIQGELNWFTALNVEQKILMTLLFVQTVAHLYSHRLILIVEEIGIEETNVLGEGIGRSGQY